MGDEIDPTKIADFNADQNSAFDATRGFEQGNPYQTALKQMTGTASGDFLYGGAAQDAFLQATANRAMPGIMSAFNTSGRSGGQLSQLQLGKVYGDANALLYNQERDRMMSAAGQLPGMAQIPINMMMGIGNAQMEREQAVNNAAKQAQDQERARDAEIAKYASTAVPWSSVTGQTTQGTTNQTGTTSTPMYSNPAASAMGGAIGGAQLGNAVMPGYGMIPGAILGGVMGYYG